MFAKHFDGATFDSKAQSRTNASQTNSIRKRTFKYMQVDLTLTICEYSIFRTSRGTLIFWIFYLPTTKFSNILCASQPLQAVWIGGVPFWCVFLRKDLLICWQSSCISDWEVNTLHCSCFLCLALAAFSFAHDWLWPGRAALALPFALSAVQAFQPDSAEKLAVRLWEAGAFVGQQWREGQKAVEGVCFSCWGFCTWIEVLELQLLVS